MRCFPISKVLRLFHGITILRNEEQRDIFGIRTEATIISWSSDRDMQRDKRRMCVARQQRGNTRGFTTTTVVGGQYYVRIGFFLIPPACSGNARNFTSPGRRKRALLQPESDGLSCILYTNLV